MFRNQIQSPFLTNTAVALHLQIVTFSNKPCENEVILRENNQTLNQYQHLELLIYFEKGFRTSQTGNIGSVGQRAA